MNVMPSSSSENRGNVDIETAFADANVLGSSDRRKAEFLLDQDVPTQKAVFRTIQDYTPEKLETLRTALSTVYREKLTGEQIPPSDRIKIEDRYLRSTSEIDGMIIKNQEPKPEPLQQQITQTPLVSRTL